MWQQSTLTRALSNDSVLACPRVSNRVLVLGKETFNPIFTLMLSADEQVHNPEGECGRWRGEAAWTLVASRGGGVGMPLDWQGS